MSRLFSLAKNNNAVFGISNFQFNSKCFKHKRGLSYLARFSAKKGVSIHEYRALSPWTTPTCGLSSGPDGQKVLPSEAEVVVCGGGVVGASVALHLKMMGWRNVVLLEQGKLTCGTTWHSVGLLGRLKVSQLQSALASYTRDLYIQLEEEGYNTGWKRCGAVYLARTEDRLIQYQRSLCHAEVEGVEGGRIVTPDEVKEMVPFLLTDDLKGAVYVPGDGALSAPDAAIAMARKAKDLGVHVHEEVQVKRVIAEGGQVRAVETNRGDIQCPIFVNAAGMWARDLGEKCTVPVRVPLHACEHFYIVTKAMEGVDRMMPVIRDYDGYIYMREWSGGLLLGGFEPIAKPIFTEGVTEKFEFDLLPEDWDQFQVLMDQMLLRVPSLETAEVRQLVNGPESFTPDGKYIVGEAPEVKNYFVAAAMNSLGITVAGAIGKHLSEWITDGRPSVDLSALDIRRFTEGHANKQFLRERVKETLGLFDKPRPPIPDHRFSSGRFVAPSPLYKPQQDLGALFEQQPNLYERVAWFGNADIADSETNFGKSTWFNQVRQEYLACREAIGLVDMSSLTKFEISSCGREAEHFLQYLCSNNVVPDESGVGTIVHTGMLNKHGGYEMDCSVVRLSDSRFFILGHTAQQTRNMAWLTKHLPRDGSVNLLDVTSKYSAINIIGPKSREMLSEITTTRTGSNSFPQSTCQELEFPFGGVKAMRMTLSNEDGWLLLVPTQHSLAVYDTLMSTGKNYGIQNAGYYALQALRVETFSPWATGVNAFTSPLECNRQDQVKWDVGDFIGHDALLKKKDEGIKKKLVQFFLQNHNTEDDLWPWGGEPIYRNGHYCGNTTSTAYSYALNKHVCLGYVENIDPETKQKGCVDDEFITKDAEFEVNIAGKYFPAKANII